MIGTLNDDLDCYALVITGQVGEVFSAGADLNLFADDPAKAQAMAEAFHEAFTALTHFRAYPLRPLMATQWVAASNAHCCDIRIAETRRKNATEATVGLLPVVWYSASPWIVGELGKTNDFVW